MAPTCSDIRDVIDRFRFAREGGYSSFWRRDKSPVEALELAKVLVAIRKIASYIGPNVGNIYWAGMNYEDGIGIDAGPILGRYPLPAYKTDIIVGQAVRSAYIKTEWSERFKQLAGLRFQESTTHAKIEFFDLFFDTCEKVYVDAIANRSVLGRYAEKAREWEISEKSKEFWQPPTLVELLYIWWAIAADRSGTKYRDEYKDTSVGASIRGVSLETFYKEPLNLLNSIADRLIKDCPKINGVTERGQFRLDLYASIWPNLFEMIRFWPMDRADMLRQSPESRQDIEECDADDNGQEANSVIHSFQDLIEKAIRKKNSDFTETVRSNVKKTDEVVTVEGSDIVLQARDKVDKKLLQRLKMIIKTAAQRKTIHNRGLKAGKIDRRKLYRAATTGTVFQLKKNQFELANDIVLLVDASGSMAEPTKWDQTETIHQTLFSVAKTFNKNARIFAYNEVRDRCLLTELYTDGRFYTVLPHGKTASGEAIIATGTRLKKTRKKPLIIHITDGASNWGCGVNEALKFCIRKKIHLLTIGIGCGPDDKRSLRKEYGKLVQFVDNVHHLPHFFRSLLNHARWN
ncbi:hypothetical protein DSCW_52780 [Desulfosarcina widdelii]|uniref:Uncharacterized protein n=1 Tax=Desulfosarcina widdelii TaxID=947919 RepID=A0A5K7ZDR1_9BACT|nr:vWA domain-containing protein [Desulfosarcina widdelii]BBO77861.1 hypothetical protein DSCW_52780 [Desulfosarcina widdelii]